MRYRSDAPARGISPHAASSGRSAVTSLPSPGRATETTSPSCSWVQPARAQRPRAPWLQPSSRLRTATVPVPLIGDGVGLWLEPRVAVVLRNAGIKTLADLTLRDTAPQALVEAGINGLGVAGARRIEPFFAAHADLTDRACARYSSLWCHRMCFPGRAPRRAARGGRQQGSASCAARVVRPGCGRTTTTRRSRLGCRCTKRLQRSGPTARQPNG